MTPLINRNDASEPISRTKRCRQCLVRRKKCDLTRPSCGRCTKVGLKCSFGDAELNCEHHHPPSTSKLVAVSSEASMRPVSYFNANAICSLVKPFRNCIIDATMPFFEGFNKWLPVIDKTNFELRTMQVDSLTDPAFCALILSCVLLSRISSPGLSGFDDEGIEDLYLKLSVSLAFLTSRNMMTLEVLQAKTLMALYEHLQANTTAAIGTVSSASAVAKKLGYFQWNCRKATDASLEDDEGHRAACCLYVLERLIYVANKHEDHGHMVFSVPRPCPNRALSDDHTQSLTLILDNNCYCDRYDHAHITGIPDGSALQGPSLLKRAFQASLLLDIAISEASMSSILDESTSLDRRRAVQMAINSFVYSLLGDRDQGAEVNCSVLAICVISILTIHDGDDDQNGLIVDESLMSAMRMVFDRLQIVPTFQYQFSKVISVWELHCFYLTARKYLKLRSLLGSQMEKGADQALAVTIKTLQEYSQQWKIADEFLTRLRLFTPVLNQ